MWAFQASLGHPILHACELCKHRWDNLSCMAVSVSSNSGIPILHGCDMAVNFSSISGILILHGCELSSISGILILHGCDMAVSFLSVSGILILNGCELFKHLWDILSCMAVRFSSISGTTYGCELFKSLWNTYPAWL